jgi:hypothetical protein
MEADGSTPKTTSAGNPDLRPIGMGGSLWGLVLRAALRSCKAEMQATLVEVGQFGFGVSSGLETVAVSVSSWQADADDQALQSVVGTWDGKNTYPSVSRAAMLDAVRAACPQLAPPVPAGLRRPAPHGVRSSLAWKTPNIRLCL